jgi:hypothetical protein
LINQEWIPIEKDFVKSVEFKSVFRIENTFLSTETLCVWTSK